MARLGDYVRIRTGKLDANASVTDGIYPFFTCAVEPLRINSYAYDCECVLVAGNGDLNVKYYSGRFEAYQRTYIIESVDKEKLSVKYLYYFLDKYVDILRNQAIGGVIKYIKLGYLTEAQIPVPSLAEQEYIVSLMEKANELINNRKQQLEKLDELVKARFVELFDDGESPRKTVEELCTAIVDCPHTTPKYEGELKNPAIRTAEIKKGYIAWETMRYVSDEEYEERIARLKPEAGDIVYGREGTFGNAAILPGGYNFCLGQRVMLLRPDYTKCTSEYLLYAVISDDVYRQATEKNNASTVAHVNVKDVKQFQIPLPSFDKQEQFAAFVEQTDKSKAEIQKSLVQLETLKKALMQKYFG